MSDIERYETLIKAALEIKHLEQLLIDQINIIKRNIMVDEWKNYRFDEKAANRAVGIVLDETEAVAKEASYVDGQLAYKNMEDISLFTKTPREEGNQVMMHIFDSVKKTMVESKDGFTLVLKR